MERTVVITLRVMVAITRSISYNQALGGYGDAGGTNGLGMSGGVYNLGTFVFDAITVITHNHASDSNDDGFGY